MTWGVSADVDDFEEAIQWFRARTPMADDEWAKLTDDAHRKAFRVAGVADLDLVAQVQKELEFAITDGTTLADFKEAVAEKLKAAWVGKGIDPASRIETIFRVNTQLSYGAGRYKQLTDPAVAKFRPFWLFDSVADHRRSPICTSISNQLAGKALPADDPFWTDHVPPLHVKCRSGIRSLRRSEAEQRGIAETAPAVQSAPGFGKAPGVDEWQPDLTKYPADLAKTFEEKQKAPPPSTIAHEEAKEGIHFAKLVSNVKPAQQKVALDALRDFNLLPFLERAPLGEIHLQNTLKKPGIHGLYWENSKRLALRMKKPGRIGAFGNKFEPGTNWTMASTADTWEEALRRNMLHEVGHHIHLSGDLSVRDQVTNAFRARQVRGLPTITRYAKTDEAEYFAETFSAYKLDPMALQDFDPIGFSMVESVLRSRGIIS